MVADTKNAHVRKGTTKRKTPDIQSSEAERLLNDPAFVRGMDAAENGIVSLICDTKHDGSPQCDAAEREMCRSLRTLRGLKRIIAVSVQGQKLRLADFQSGLPEDDEE